MAKTLRIVTWNINSVRIRTRLLQRVVKRLNPDVLCLQEIKCAAEDFCTKPVERMGYPHQLVRGFKGHGGTAILSRIPFESTGGLDWCGRTDGRHAIATVGGIEIHCFYVPSGVPIPDPKANPAFAHKLKFLDDMAAWSRKVARKPGRRVLVGDLNVAPLENDVWSHRQTLKDVSHTPAETTRFEKARAAGKWVDAMREFVPPEDKLYTWWSYRAIDWKASNRGRRLDHVWVSPALKPALKSMTVLDEARGWPSPSDHVPVLIELAL
ncbi:MAG: exodeoxyribonuclease III [Gemmatimonas sp.]